MRVYARPKVAILTTGDELLSPEETPGPGQIREGNTLHLAAMVQAAGAQARNLGVCRDELDELARAISGALEECDALITTVTTDTTAPVIVGQRLRKGSCGSARGAARMIADTLSTVERLRQATAVGSGAATPAMPTPLVRADSAFYGYPTISAALRS